ncbi:39S ribosomal protein L42, mitochondrial [Trichomycterus rosablanca]|uniref:39S ribosomal protein L42, mitochondrial n=1 Tax=Trichomycterus rosablanca TaxID=2290929 RepID=UPI002F35356E
MASSLSQLRLLHGVLNHVCCKICKNIGQVKVQALSFNATCQVPDSRSNCNVELGVTRNGETVVCVHPAKDFSYEFTKPIPRQDSTTDPAESFDLVLKSHLNQKLKNKKSSTMDELSQVFHTTKHCWYPAGQYHTRRRNQNPPKDR